ncbi:hypothetical protein JCM18237_30140 [Halorubrum luteum]
MVGVKALFTAVRAATATAVAAPLWRVRSLAARVSDRLPDAVVPYQLSVLPPPDAEYAGVWDRPPAVARRRLIDEYGFSQQLRAYLHAYERDGRTVYETASCAYRPEGFTGTWQLHVRLFPAGPDRTDVWCHWERNPNVSPIAHLRQEGYDPEEGVRRFRELVSEPIQPPSGENAPATGCGGRTVDEGGRSMEDVAEIRRSPDHVDDADDD